MVILLDHVIVPSRRPMSSAQALAGLLGVGWRRRSDISTHAVYVNESLILDFDRSERFERHHYCFHVGDEEFDGIFERVRGAEIKYRSMPNGDDDLRINTRMGTELYWNDDDGHLWEVLTVSYARRGA